MKLEELFQSLGYTLDEYKFIRYNEKVLTISDNQVSTNLASLNVFFDSKGYDPDKIHNFIKYNSELLIHDKDYYQNSWSELKKYNYTDEEIYKMVKHKPTVLMLTLTEIIIRIESLKSLGYTDKDIKIMSINTPSIYVQPFNYITDKLHYLIEYGFTKEQAIRITSLLSTVFDYSYDTIEQRLDLFEYLNLHNLVYNKPITLRQSPKLTYARYKYFQDKGIEVNEQKYKKLFMSEKQFMDIHKISNIDLMNKYNYDEEIQKEIKEKKKVLI